MSVRYYWIRIQRFEHIQYSIGYDGYLIEEKAGTDPESVWEEFPGEEP